MWPYFLIVFFIIFLQIFSFTNRTFRKLAYLLGIFTLFLFAALRGNGLGDYFTYLTRGADIWFFKDAFSSSLGMEPGYGMLCFFSNRLGLSSQFVIIAMNMLSIFFLSLFIKKYSNNCILSLLLFLPLYFQFDMHAARTAVAISITAYSTIYAVSKKKIRFFLMICMASLFHKTAWITLILYFIAKMKNNFTRGICAIVCMIVVQSLFNIDIFIQGVLNFLNLNRMALSYATYMNSSLYGYKMRLYDPRILLIIGTWLIANIVIKKGSKVQQFMMNCCLINALAYITFRQHTFIAYRLGAYFNIYTIILIPQILEKLKCIQYNNSSLAQCFERQKAVYNLIAVNSVYLVYIVGLIYSSYVRNGIDYKLFFISA